jgi:hypothetical protein
MAKVRAQWLRLSEESNALDYLEKAHLFLTHLQYDKRAWKWIILCLHTSLYGWAICALRGTSPANVTFKTKKGREKLISFGEAIDRCQDPRFMILTINSKVLTLTESQQDSIKELKETFRNSFEHFIPKGWSIETHGFPQMALDVLNIIRFLALDSGNYIHLKPSEEIRFKSLIYQSRKIIKGMRIYKEALLISTNHSIKNKILN